MESRHAELRAEGSSPVPSTVGSWSQVHSGHLDSGSRRKCRLIPVASMRPCVGCLLRHRSAGVEGRLAAFTSRSFTALIPQALAHCQSPSRSRRLTTWECPRLVGSQCHDLEGRGPSQRCCHCPASSPLLPGEAHGHPSPTWGRLQLAARSLGSQGLLSSATFSLENSGPSPDTYKGHWMRPCPPCPSAQPELQPPAWYR